VKELHPFTKIVYANIVNSLSFEEFYATVLKHGVFLNKEFDSIEYWKNLYSELRIEE
jgi:hypothetical protein